MERQNSPKIDNRTLKFLRRQACVKSIFNSSLNEEIKNDMRKFISRNIIKDCQRVSPNCLKAHLIKTALSKNISKNKISKIKNIFKSKVGYEGYYLDSGKLKKV